MACCGVAMGLFLFSLLFPAVLTQVENLPEIISFLHKTYGSADKEQVALAINVPLEKCSKDFHPDEQNFLKDNDANEVKDAMNSEARVYEGDQLIGAKPKPIPNTEANYHSEYLLLVNSNPPAISTNDPPMKKLLKNDQNGCVVFYTVNSPCVKNCLNSSSPYSIIKALDMFMEHKGPKAFVFKQVWKYDVNKNDWMLKITEINSKVPLYRCENGVCTACVNENNVDAKCKSN